MIGTGGTTDALADRARTAGPTGAEAALDVVAPMSLTPSARRTIPGDVLHVAVTNTP